MSVTTIATKTYSLLTGWDETVYLSPGEEETKDTDPKCSNPHCQKIHPLYQTTRGGSNRKCRYLCWDCQEVYVLMSVPQSNGKSGTVLCFDGHCFHLIPKPKNNRG